MSICLNESFNFLVLISSSEFMKYFSPQLEIILGRIQEILQSPSQHKFQLCSFQEISLGLFGQLI